MSLKNLQMFRTWTFPLVYGLLCGKSIPVYTDFLDELEKLIGQKMQFDEIYCDLERAIHRAFEKKNPKIKIGFCRTHLYRNLQGHLQTSGLWKYVLKKNNPMQDFWYILRGLVHTPLNDNKMKKVVMAKFRKMHKDAKKAKFSHEKVSL